MKHVERVLLLGGGGFLGRALGLRLLDRGIEVHSITRGTQLDMPDGIVMHAGGMENLGVLRGLLPQVDAVIHLASATTPSVSRSAPSLEASLNLGPTLGFLEELHYHPNARLIFVSSGGTIYGNAGMDITPESAPAQPLSYYGAGKLAIETFMQCFERMSGRPAVIVRPSNLYGQGQPLYLGFAVIRTMLQHALDGTTMEIWGDGSIVRDFIHVDDVTAAIECILEDPTASGTFNVGSGEGHSLNDLADIIGKVTERPLQVKYELARKIDVQRIVLDCGLISKRFGWHPRTPLAEGIASTWEWLRAANDPRTVPEHA